MAVILFALHETGGRRWYGEGRGGNNHFSPQRIGVCIGYLVGGNERQV